MTILTKKGWRYLWPALVFILCSALSIPQNAWAFGNATHRAPTFDAPDTPTLLTPLNGADNVPDMVPLRWSPVDGADRYNVQVATDQAFSSIIWAVNVPASPVDFPAPESDAVYFWRVQASNTDGMSAYSAPFMFSTGTIVHETCSVETPSLLTPQNNSFGNPDSVLLRWESVEGAERYNVQVALDNHFGDPLFDANLPHSPVWFVAPMPDTTFYWHVQAVGPERMCAYGETWHFSTAMEPVSGVETPTLLTPLNNANDVSTSVALRFAPVEGAERYNVQVALDYAFGSIIWSANVPRSPVSFMAPSDGTTYYWRAQAVDNGVMSKFSAPFWFTTEGETEQAEGENPMAASRAAGFVLRDAFPNPFNPTTNITVEIPEATHLRIAVYDMLGKEVMEVTARDVDPGTYMYTVDAADLSSGTYLYRIETPEFTDTKRMVLLK